jgi:iron complex transport system ATP-binding protein
MPQASIDRHGFAASHLDYAYANSPLVVRDVSVTSIQGSMTAVIGANGSGKSTLIRMLAGLLRPRAGTILVDGIPFEDWQPRMRARQIAYVPQSTATAFPFQVIDLVLSGRTPHTPRFGFESAHDSEKAMAALDTAGAAHLAGRCFTSLSGGEPSSSLDLKHRADLIRTLARLRETQHLSVIMITHDLQLTSAFDQLLALRCGEVAALGPPDEVLRDHVLRDIFGDPNVRSQRIGGQTLVWVDL